MWQERGTSSYNFQIKKRGNRDVKEVAVISGRNPEDTIKSLLAERVFRASTWCPLRTVPQGKAHLKQPKGPFTVCAPLVAGPAPSQDPVPDPCWYWPCFREVNLQLGFSCSCLAVREENMLKCECFTLTLPKHPSPEALRTHPEEEPPPGIYTSSSAGCFVFISTVGPF